MKMIIIISALFCAALTHADEMTPFIPSDPATYNKLRSFFIQVDKDNFISQQNDSVVGANMNGPVSPNELYKSYERNELAANKKYKNKSVRVVGTANEIGEDALGKPYVEAISGKPDAFSGLRSAKLYFENSNEKLLNLSKGEKIDVICVGKGYIIHSPLLDKCFFTSELNVDNVLNEQILPADKLTVQNFSKLPSQESVIMNLLLIAASSPSSKAIYNCNKGPKSCSKFITSDEFAKFSKKYISDNADEIKLLLQKRKDNINGSLSK